MDNKKTLYWALGVIGVLLVIFLFWGLSRDKTEDPQNMQTPSAGQAGNSGANSGADAGASDSGSDAHAGMNHGAAGTAQPGTDAGTDADSHYTRYMEEQTAIMDRMMRDMELTEDTGNAALDFLEGMIPHHEAAVSMAESYLNNGGSQKELKPLAEDIITAQKSEITQMKDMQKTISASGRNDQEKADAYREEYQKMMTGHHDGHGTSHNDDSGTTTGAPIDAAFAEGMIMHHQMAVDMAKGILDNTDEEDVLTLARQIIDAQEEEISLMEKVLQGH